MRIWFASCLMLMAMLAACSAEPQEGRELWARQLSPEGYSEVAESRYSEDDYVDDGGHSDYSPGYSERDYSPIQERDYKPAKPQCHPHTVTKYRTVFKDRKANVFNKVEVRNPRPQVHKTKETRHTTIRYPVFITQVVKPLLTQVETKVKPLFFTKTLKRIKTIVFTVTGIGQVTVTSVKFEKEFVTRCNKKGYGGHHGGGGGGGHKGGGGSKGHGGGYHRREDQGDAEYVDPDYVSAPSYFTDRLDSYDDVYSSRDRSSSGGRYKRDVDLTPSMSEVAADKTQSIMTKPLPKLS